MYGVYAASPIRISSLSTICWPFIKERIPTIFWIIPKILKSPMKLSFYNKVIVKYKKTFKNECHAGFGVLISFIRCYFPVAIFSSSPLRNVLFEHRRRRHLLDFVMLRNFMNQRERYVHECGILNFSLFRNIVM